MNQPENINYLLSRCRLRSHPKNSATVVFS